MAPLRRGVYVLYWKHTIVYAGKALNTTLRRRLGEHSRKIAGRQNITLDDMTCRFLTIDSDWFVRAAEDTLMTGYKPLWKYSGLGNHIPGIGWPGIRISRWDQEFPAQ